MLIINETIRTAFFSHLRARCHVLDATLADEDEHHAFGWTYVGASLRRFPVSTLPRAHFPAGDAVQTLHGFFVRDFPPVIEICDARIYFVSKRGVFVCGGTDVVELVELRL